MLNQKIPQTSRISLTATGEHPPVAACRSRSKHDQAQQFILGQWSREWQRPNLAPGRTVGSRSSVGSSSSLWDFAVSTQAKQARQSLLVDAGRLRLLANAGRVLWSQGSIGSILATGELRGDDHVYGLSAGSHVLYLLDLANAESVGDMRLAGHR